MRYRLEIKGLDVSNHENVSVNLFDDLGIARLFIASHLVYAGHHLNLKNQLSKVDFRAIRKKGDGFKLDCDIKLYGDLLTVAHIEFTQIK